MGIKIKNRDPKSTDFDKNDIIINNQDGTLFFKTSNNNLFKIQGDKIDTPETELTTNNNISVTNITSSIIATGNISASLTGSFGRIECLAISSSTGDFDASTVRIGGTSFNKADLDNLKQGKSIITSDNQLSLAARGQAEAEDNNTNYIRPTLIMHPTDNESALIHKTAHRLHFRCAGGDPFEIFGDGGSNDFVRLGSTTTNATTIRLHGTVSASINGGSF